MPFVSKAQVRKLWRTNPELAKRFTAETPDMRRLPEHVKKIKKYVKNKHHV